MTSAGNRGERGAGTGSGNSSPDDSTENSVVFTPFSGPTDQADGRRLLVPQAKAEPPPSSLGAAASLAVTRVGNLSGMPRGNRWLIDQLWAASGVGIVGGTPKTGKTWLGLEFAVAVASGTPALGRFDVPEAGPTLVYPAEDQPEAVRDRVEALCAHRDVDVDSLALHVITAERLSLDNEADRRGLEEALETVKPKLMLLDPLVRLHAGAENHAGHISKLLGYLRGLQRRFGVAIVLTHHVSKKGRAEGGLGLRGSSDLHAWGDSNAYLHRNKGKVILQLEHRSAPALDPLEVRLVSDAHDGGVRWEIDFELDEEVEGVQTRAPAPHPELPLAEQIVKLLEASDVSLSQVSLRRVLRVRNKRLTDALRELEQAGAIKRLGQVGGWCLGNVS